MQIQTLLAELACDYLLLDLTFKIKLEQLYFIGLLSDHKTNILSDY